MSILDAEICYDNGYKMLDESGVNESMSWFQQGMSYSSPECYNKLCCGIFITQQLWDKKFNDIRCSYYDDAAYKAFLYFYESYSKGLHPDDYSLYFLGKISAYLGKIYKYFSYDDVLCEKGIYTGGELPYIPSLDDLIYLEFSSQCFMRYKKLYGDSLTDVISNKSYITLEAIQNVLEFIKDEVLNPTFYSDGFDGRYPTDKNRERYISILTGINLEFKTLPFGYEPKLKERNIYICKEMGAFDMFYRLLTFCFLDASTMLALKNGTFVFSDRIIPSGELATKFPYPSNYVKKEKDLVYTKVVGVSLDDRQNIIKNLRVTQDLRLLREPRNKYDKNAIAVFTADKQIGYIDRELASKLAPLLDDGREYKCHVDSILGGGDYTYYGLRIIILVYGVRIGTAFSGYKIPSNQNTPKSKPQENITHNNEDLEEGYYFEHFEDYEDYLDSLDK